MGVGIYLIFKNVTYDNRIVSDVDWKIIIGTDKTILPVNHHSQTTKL